MKENETRLAMIETMCGVTPTMATIATIELTYEMTRLALQVTELDARASIFILADLAVLTLTLFVCKNAIDLKHAILRDQQRSECIRQRRAARDETPARPTKRDITLRLVR